MAKTQGLRKVQSKSFGFMSIRNQAKKDTFAHYSKMTPGATAQRATVDDATWDKAVMEVMEEFDEAWTQLADK